MHAPNSVVGSIWWCTCMKIGLSVRKSRYTLKEIVLDAYDAQSQTATQELEVNIVSYTHMVHLNVRKVKMHTAWNRSGGL